MSSPESRINNPQDLDDAIELAFWGVDFDELDPEDAPFDSDVNPTIKVTRYLSREKSGHDVRKGCFVLISHFVVDLAEEGYEDTEPGEALMIEWDDGESLIYDITDSTAGTLGEFGDVGLKDIDAQEIAAFRYSVKMALASVTSID